jgi:hypothetical protein
MSEMTMMQWKLLHIISIEEKKSKKVEGRKSNQEKNPTLLTESTKKFINLQ